MTWPRLIRFGQTQTTNENTLQFASKIWHWAKTHDHLATYWVVKGIWVETRKSNSAPIRIQIGIKDVPEDFQATFKFTLTLLHSDSQGQQKWFKFFFGVYSHRLISQPWLNLWLQTTLSMKTKGSWQRMLSTSTSLADIARANCWFVGNPCWNLSLGNHDGDIFFKQSRSGLVTSEWSDHHDLWPVTLLHTHTPQTALRQYLIVNSPAQPLAYAESWNDFLVTSWSTSTAKNKKATSHL